MRAQIERFAIHPVVPRNSNLNSRFICKWSLDGAVVSAAMAVYDDAPQTQTKHETLIVGSGWTRRVPIAEAVRVARSHQPHRLGVEVLDETEAAQAVGAGADFIVARAFEGPGFVSEESLFTLTRRLLGLGLGKAIWARGGIGPAAAAVLAVWGTEAILCDSQFWLCSDIGVCDEVCHMLRVFQALDTKTLGTAAKLRYRVFGQTATRSIRNARKDPVIETGTDAATVATLLIQHTQAPGQAGPSESLVPLGQEAVFATWFADLPLEDAMRRYRDRAGEHLQAAHTHWPLAIGKGIAAINQTALPIHQGPMAQVSDTPAFAAAVAENGAVPWLALGNMPPEVAEKIIQETRAAVTGRSFGVGIIGLDANPFRDAHIAIIRKQRPPLALVAAGSIELAQQIERDGTPTYLHTPTPDLVRNALSQRFMQLILEGAEAGGHVGALGSAVLWELGAAAANELDDSQITRVGLVVAGGICDALSAAAAAIILAPLARRGAHVGIQMGTAYLMTHEATAAGAVSPVFQEAIRRFKKTRLIGETVGAPTRILDSPQAGVLLANEIRRLQAGMPLRQRKHAFEYDNLGGLRAAAKGQRIERVDPERGATFRQISEHEQIETGLFHAGQGATFLQSVRSIASLHREVCENAFEILARRHAASTASSAIHGHGIAGSTGNGLLHRSPFSSRKPVHAEAIAVVGMALRVPKADNAEAFWKLVLECKNSIADVPLTRWDTTQYYDPDPKKPGKTYSKIGAFLEARPFDAKRFRIAPKTASRMDDTQRLALELADDVLRQAGLAEGRVKRERCAVILGNALGGDLRERTGLTVFAQEVGAIWERALTAHGITQKEARRLREAVEHTLLAKTPEINEDAMPGELANVIAGRVAAVFDLHGPNFVCDAACASALASLDAAVRGLRTHQFDVALTGGVDCAMSPSVFVKFAKIGALSPDGSYPFDARANGFVMGEGGALFVLKRLDDALRDGDTILALIRGIGSSSDGKGKGITAPNPTGQLLAIKRAYEDAGVPLDSVDYIEAHGTGTQVGDTTEFSVLTELLRSHGRKHHVVLGSAKGNVGHLKSAAGAIGLARAILALRNGVFPPQAGFQCLPDHLAVVDTPLRILKNPMPWPANGARRAGVSAFGFGGTNFHVVLEEWTQSPQRVLRPTEAIAAAAPVAEMSYDPYPNEQPVWQRSAQIVADTGLAFRDEPESTAQPSSSQNETGRVSEVPTPETTMQVSQVRNELLQILCARTGYEPNEIRDDYELESDLGIDTVKQAEIMAEARKRFGLAKDEAFRLADYPTLGKLVAYIAARLPAETAIEPAAMSAAGSVTTEKASQDADKHTVPAPTAHSTPDADLVRKTLLEILCARTGYEPSEIRDEFELEADLGIDTVKQAEIMAEARKRFGLAKDEAFRLADYPTLAKLTGYISTKIAGAEARPPTVTETTANTLANHNVLRSSRSATHGEHATQALEYRILAWGGSNQNAVITQIEKTLAAMATDPRAACDENELQARAILDQPYRVAIAATSWPALESKCREALATLRAQTPRKRLESKAIAVEEGEIPYGDIAFLFPGQGSQYVGMGKQLMGISPTTREVLERANTKMFAELGRPLTDFLFGIGLTDAEEQLKRTEITQPAVLALDIALLRELEARGIRPHRVVGHSLGEYAACVAAGVLSFEDALEAVSGRGREMAQVVPKNGDPGAMIAVFADLSTVQNVLRDMPDYVVVANENSPKQVVIGGSSPAIEHTVRLLQERGFEFVRLPVSHAFHTEIVSPAREPLMRILGRLTSWQPPSLPVASNVTGHFYPPGATKDSLIELLARQIAMPVKFITNIETLYDAGCRIFVEVGPKNVLSKLVSEILGERPHCSLFTNHPRLGDVESLGFALARLKLLGVLGSAQPSRVSDSTRRVSADTTRPAPCSDDAICVTGLAIGLPGPGDPFDAAKIDALFGGRSAIRTLAADERERILAKNITRLEKTDAGGELRPVTSQDEVIHLAATLATPDLNCGYGFAGDRQESLDATSRLAIAAGIHALADASIPLVPSYKQARDGHKLRGGWKLPETIGVRTGVIFASVFTGFDAFAEQIRQTNAGQPFRRDFILRILGMAHARFAEHIGAKGPCIRLDCACTSTTAAFMTAWDWIRLGRVDRVVIIAADNATSEPLLDWLGAGFLAAGAATTAKTPEDGALPFDKRRNGMILGAGTVAFVVERYCDAMARGVTPRAEIVGVRVENSAGHPTRLDTDHIAAVTSAFVNETSQRLGISPRMLADEGFFMSHETYTPARGGSAQSEVAALRRAFPEPERMVIANTKGFTGHPMGAAIEDAIAILAMARGVLPPVANLRDVDDSFRDLRFSRGEPHPTRYALRFSAGFGSHVGLTLYRNIAGGAHRVDEDRHRAWLMTVTGSANPHERREGHLWVCDESPMCVKPAVPARCVVWSRRAAPPVPSRSIVAQVTGTSSPLVEHVAAALTRTGVKLVERGCADVTIHVVGDELSPVDTVLRLREAALTHQPETNGVFAVWAFTKRCEESATVGAAAGFVRTLAREWSATQRVCGLEIGVGIGETPASNEAQKPDWVSSLPWAAFVGHAVSGHECCWVRYEGDFLESVDENDSYPDTISPRLDDVWVFIGGGRGITAQCALRLARFGIKHVALIGRTPHPTEADANFDAVEVRSRIKAAWMAQGVVFTPVKLNAEVARVRARHELYTTLAALRAAGADPLYYVADVCDSRAISEVMASIAARWGRIDVLVHGAGIEESRLLAEKKVEMIRNTIDTKVAGCQIAVDAARPFGLRRVVAFSSIAARYGNRGQTDYAAANEAMRRELSRLTRENVSTVVIDWTGWAQIGMAARGSIPEQLQAAGIELLAPDEGAEAFAALALSGRNGEWVVAKGLGQLANQSTHSMQTPNSETWVQVPTEGPINQHRIEGTAVFPGAVALAHFARAVQPESEGVEFRSVAFERLLKFHRDEPIKIHISTQPNGTGFTVSLHSERRTPWGRPISTEHFRAHVAPTSFHDNGERVCFDETGPYFSGAESSEIYRRFFHTGCFQVLARVCIQTNHFVCAETAPRQPDLPWLAYAFEAMFQTAGYWVLAWHGMHALPSALDQAVVITTAPKPEEHLWVRAVPVMTALDTSGSSRLSFDVELLGSDGRLLARMRGFRLVELRAADPLETAALVQEPRPIVRIANTSEYHDAWLTSAERRLRDTYPTPQRRQEFAAGRAALKAVVAQAQIMFHGRSLPSYTSIEIQSEEEGAPRIVAPAHMATCGVSITHRGETCVAGLMPPGWRLGLDVETVESRLESFIEHIATQREAELLPHTQHMNVWMASALWAAKEALAKALGRGLRLDLHEIAALAPLAPGKAVAFALTGQAAITAGISAAMVYVLDHQPEIIVWTALPDHVHGKTSVVPFARDLVRLT